MLDSCIKVFYAVVMVKKLNNAGRRHAGQKKDMGDGQFVTVEFSSLNRAQRRAYLSSKKGKYHGLTRPTDNGYANGGKKRYG